RLIGDCCIWSILLTRRNCPSPYRDEQGLRTPPCTPDAAALSTGGAERSSQEDERNPGCRASARQRPLSANVLGHSQYSSDEIVEGKRAWPPSHDAERHRGPRDMDRPTVGNGQLDNASHEEQPGRGEASREPEHEQDGKAKLRASGQEGEQRGRGIRIGAAWQM